MEIIHHFGFRVTGEEEKRAFERAGIPLQSAARIPDGSLMVSFDVAESDPRWAESAQLAARYKSIETVSTRFSREECDAARYLGMVANSHRGFPEPMAGKGYLAATFDLSDFCAHCGVGRRQSHPFRVKSTPKLHNSILQLNWVFDEFFVDPKVWEAVFKPLGVGCRPVLRDKDGAELRRVVQLDVSQSAALKLCDGRGLPCPHCNRAKCPVSLRGFFPQPDFIPASTPATQATPTPATPAHIFRSKEYFGSGAGAFNLIYVSSALYRKIRDAALHGVNFYPAASAANL